MMLRMEDTKDGIITLDPTVIEEARVVDGVLLDEDGEEEVAIGDTVLVTDCGAVETDTDGRIKYTCTCPWGCTSGQEAIVRGFDLSPRLNAAAQAEFEQIQGDLDSLGRRFPAVSRRLDDVVRRIHGHLVRMVDEARANGTEYRPD